MNVMQSGASGNGGSSGYGSCDILRVRFPGDRSGRYENDIEIKQNYGKHELPPGILKWRSIRGCYEIRIMCALIDRTRKEKLLKDLTFVKEFA